MTKQSKTLQMLNRLKQLAQFDTSHPSNASHMLGDLLTDDDAENYRRLDFTPEMIRFTEDFNHDAVHEE